MIIYFRPKLCVFPCDWHNKSFVLLYYGADLGHWNFSASGTTITTDNDLVLDCFQIIGHFVIIKYVLLIYFAKQIYYKLYELK